MTRLDNQTIQSNCFGRIIKKAADPLVLLKRTVSLE
jgi:hypothetical protein